MCVFCENKKPSDSMETTLKNAEFDSKLAVFVEKVQEMRTAHYAESFPNAKPGTMLYDTPITTKIGRRYVGLWTGKSIFCFVDKTNGDILKAATWRAPAKHARGSIFALDNGIGAVGVYGANYLTR